MSKESTIRDVADTALWVAALRGAESGRVDAAFHDPLASMLAGERGAKIARTFPDAAAVAWSVVIRTAAIDRLLEDALRQGVDTIVNLGAGMDTRPYRFRLPAKCRWIEIDLPHMIENKNRLLAEHPACCVVERIGVDLLDRPARNASLARIAAASTKSLLIAEGVIPYFSNADAAALARDLHALPPFAEWILDFDNAGMRRLPTKWTQRLAEAPFRFEVADWFGFFADSGWRKKAVITSADESERLMRPYPLGFPRSWVMHVLPRAMGRRILEASGAALLSRGCT